MKRSLTLLLLALAGSTGAAQTIYTVDNNPGAVGGANVYTGPTALQDAIADPVIVAGDIIHVTRSSVDYGAITIDRQLNIFGIGLNPDTDGSERSIVSTVNITEPAASGSRISGLHIVTILNLGGTAGDLLNLLIENSNILRIQHTTNTTILSNLVIRNNVLGSGGSAGTDETIDLLLDFHSNVIIANNVIYVRSDNAQGSVTANNGTSVENNLFIGGDTQDRPFENFHGNTVKNNIFIGMRVDATNGVSDNTFENNLSYLCANCAFPSTNGNTKTGNLENVDPLMANVPTGYSIDFATFNPTLDTTTPSPAIGAGEGGTDMGVFGGPAPMTLQGTLIPLIQSLTLPSMVLKGDSLAVQIKARGN
jgi:hypothetical protein